MAVDDIPGYGTILLFLIFGKISVLGGGTLIASFVAESDIGLPVAVGPGLVFHPEGVVLCPRFMDNVRSGSTSKVRFWNRHTHVVIAERSGLERCCLVQAICLWTA